MTVQHLDTIIYKGKKHLLYSEPFSVFIENNQLEDKFPVLSTACWRGYYSQWEIIEDQLFLTWLGDDDENKSSSAFHLKDFFPDEEKVFADWYTGEIDMVNYTEDVFNPEGFKFFGQPYELFKTLYIDKGIVKGEIVQLLEAYVSDGAIVLNELINQLDDSSFVIVINENYVDEDNSSFNSFLNLDTALDYLIDKYSLFDLYLKSFNSVIGKTLSKKLTSQAKFDSSWESVKQGK